MQKGGNYYEQKQRYNVGRAQNRNCKGTWVYNTVSKEGWGSVSSRDCGNIVKKAIEMAERNLASK
ncbi:small acid-soluble spore protein [Acetivibrio straminisolvens JCM 21531]|uniref:Small acid-soluble spore protein n=1 Tax=Acetivibrio straminisolvens JCM 21531 TaxID=1294263 RepID=W4V6W7_9FIRM|nr:small acid-soluble spore protein [Acetivibrio straminisolvens JCM 21531]